MEPAFIGVTIINNGQKISPRSGGRRRNRIATTINPIARSEQPPITSEERLSVTTRRPPPPRRMIDVRRCRCRFWGNRGRTRHGILLCGFFAVRVSPANDVGNGRGRRPLGPWSSEIKAVQQHVCARSVSISSKSKINRSSSDEDGREDVASWPRAPRLMAQQVLRLPMIG